MRSDEMRFFFKTGIELLNTFIAQNLIIRWNIGCNLLLYFAFLPDSTCFHCRYGFRPADSVARCYNACKSLKKTFHLALGSLHTFDVMAEEPSQPRQHTVLILIPKVQQQSTKYNYSVFHLLSSCRAVTWL